MSKNFGMIGLGTMGRNFLLNVAEHGFSCVGYDLDAAKRALLLEEGKSYTIAAAEDLPAFVAALESPRKIMLLVPAGPIVDAVIGDLIPHLEPGDIVIDGGNSHFTDTERRETFLNEKGIEFLGVGVSGGEEGARHGASIMIGGKPEIYQIVRPIFEAASAKVNGEPCAAHVGKGSAGHFVKMVHNGIEYGLMQLIAETYDLLKHTGGNASVKERGQDDLAIADIFAEWNQGELNSFLIEITATVLKKKDDETGEPLVEMILDTAGQKGTGKWTSQAAMDLGVPIPTIDSAVTMRQISARKVERVAASKILGAAKKTIEDLKSSPHYKEGISSPPGLRRGADASSAGWSDDGVVLSLNDIKDALFTAFIITYAQGFSLLQAASAEKGYALDMVEIAKIWRGGCIIRAALLEDIRASFAAEPALENILVSAEFSPVVAAKHQSLRTFLALADGLNIPSMSAAASLNYLKAFAAERLPANLIQAQRDFFGAHTYQRTDKEGTFHTPDW